MEINSINMSETFPFGRTESAKDADNLCIDGHLAPEIVLLGAARASTSMFAQNVHKSPGIVFPSCLETDNRPFKCPPKEKGLKEMHWFNHGERMVEGKSFWLEHYPECSSLAGVRAVSVDLTPAYLANSAVPARMKTFYGKDMSRVNFLVFMRDPVKVMQSFFYYEHADKQGSFQDWAHAVVNTRQGRHFDNAIYAPHLENFFSQFNAAQFTIIPMKYNVIGGKDGQPEVTEFMWDKFALPKPPASEKMVAEWNTGTNEHPPIEEDLKPVTLAKLQKVAEELTGPKVLGRLLASSVAAGSAGPYLYGFKGNPTDADAIAAWIGNGW